MTETTAVTKFSGRDAFREAAADRLRTVADMSLYQLVDEYLRLAKIVEAGILPPSDDDYTQRFTVEADVARREGKIVATACKARFGLHLNYAHPDDDSF